MAAILLPLTDDMAGALRATLNTRLSEVERHLRAVPQVCGDDLRGVYVQQLRTLLAGLEEGISKSLRKLSVPNDALSDFLLAENGSVEQLADWATKHGQGVFERLAALEDALKDTLYFLERHSNRWDGVNGKHPQLVVEAAKAALARPPLKPFQAT